ncbi:MAG: ATP-binding protein [Actinomycetota bacterium]|nr:ATP-binding protein [Actinomycetota bacterium]MCL6093577.1 ATP-binding protein [Actinomycetota bacterium]MDA8166156.1 ATP-binding protein [Actinomycetota bacterium]
MTATSDNFAISLDRETFLRTMVVDIAYLLESSLGAACAGDYVGRVGLSMGAWIERTYRDACNLNEALTPQQYAGIIVDSKQHTGGDFSILEVTPEAVTVVSRTCPFGEAVARTPGLCRMTASVFGGIAARNFSFARVNIVHSLARGDSGCEVTIYLKPTPAALAAGGDTYTREMADVSPRIEEAAPAIRQKMQEESLFFTVLSTVVDGISVQDRDMRVIWANEAHMRMFGGDILGRHCYKAYRGGHRVCAGCPVEKTYHTGKPVRVVREEVGKGEQPLSVEIIAAPVKDRDGEIVAGIEVVRDITEQLNAQKELIEKSRRLERLAAVAKDISSGLDIDHILKRVVRNAVELTSAEGGSVALLDEEKHLINYPHHYQMPAELSNVTVSATEGLAGEVMKSGQPLLVEDYASLPAGLRAFAATGVKAVLAVPLLMRGKPVGALGMFMKSAGKRFGPEDTNMALAVADLAAVAIENANLLDETRQQLDVQRELAGAATSISRELERRVHERTEALVRMYEESERKSRELEQANMKLREVDLLKSEFLANMSHELRTPLNSIIGFSKLILDGLDGAINPEQEHDLGIVYVNAGELLRMIDDLLGLAKIEAGRVSLELQPADPADIAREVVMSFRSTAAEKGLELKLELPPEMEAVVTDRGKIRQVLMNLVGNAFKFTEAGGVRLAIEQTSDSTVFVVSDTGAGLTPDQMEAVFDRFYQVAPNPAEVGGVGLGLAISKRFVEMHGGRIWVESSPGKGSTFSFFIPSQGPAAMAGNQTG